MYIVCISFTNLTPNDHHLCKLCHFSVVLLKTCIYLPSCKRMITTSIFLSGLPSKSTLRHTNICAFVVCSLLLKYTLRISCCHKHVYVIKIFNVFYLFVKTESRLHAFASFLHFICPIYREIKIDYIINLSYCLSNLISSR